VGDRALLFHNTGPRACIINIYRFVIYEKRTNFVS
jgi:hypothetical protein